MRRRLSYANVTATLALVFAMSGGALAANSYLINSTKQINPKVLKKLAGKPGKTGPAGANGANGATGATGTQGPGGKEGAQGKEGLQGKEGVAGTALGYAHITASGELDAAHSKNVTAGDLSSSSPGFYCFRNLPFTVNNVQATIDYNGTFNGEILQILSQVPGSAGACGGSEAEAMVFIGKNKGGSTEGVTLGFYVIFN